MFDQNLPLSGARVPLGPNRLSATALRGASQLLDMNLSAAQAMMKTQARAAAALGLPDFSALFEVTGERTRHLFSDSTQQVLDTAEYAGDVAAELQRQVGRVLEAQTAQMVESWQLGLREWGVQACSGLSQLCETTRQNADEAARSVEMVARRQRETLPQAGAEIRTKAHEGMERTSQAARRTTEAARKEASPDGQSGGMEDARKAPVERGQAGEPEAKYKGLGDRGQAPGPSPRH